eukprot:CAMPEP_0175780390 /NCGR_PEP_ID=MMETSP0097-20121207/76730_1 /TAXON_ID=311494 /ORGANISM="Alexandrium monilatum, Strain CCMP3105" /LENGTH=83 /DNA_ID=CAMNT_0017091153 /DNA_START=41 /DNA_END=289 /DNA_ORIENTATION=-
MPLLLLSHQPSQDHVRCRRASGYSRECVTSAAVVVRAFVRIVHHSSAAVGWIPTVASNASLVAPAFMATPIVCIISAASAPTM